MTFEAHQGDLEDVGRQPLGAGVHGLALAGLADPVVPRRQLGDLTTTTEQGLRVAPLARLLDGLLHVGPHVRVVTRE